MFGFNNGTSKKAARTLQLVKGTGSAVDLAKVEQHGGIDLRKKTEAAGVALSKRGMAGIRAQVVMLLDYSGSMHMDYGNGNVQKLVERFLGFGLQVDADGSIPVIPFASRVLPTVDVSLENYKNIVQREIISKHSMGSTNLSDALKELKKLAETTDAPIFCGIVTDGSPDDRDETTKLVCELANYPVFLKFLALYDVPYLSQLDDLGDDKRLLDNVDAKFFKRLDQSDEEFADMMADEWDGWVQLATNKGVLTQ